jgi:hypothetical protein
MWRTLSLGLVPMMDKQSFGALCQFGFHRKAKLTLHFSCMADHEELDKQPDIH